MIWLAAILVILASAVFYMLLAPIYIEIDSGNKLCRMRFHKMAAVGIEARNNGAVFYVKFLWWQRRMNIADMLADGKQGGGKAQRKNAKKATRKQVSISKVVAVLRSFSVTRCYIDIDTGSMYANGILFPVAALLANSSGRHISINFCNNADINVCIKNNLARMAVAYIAN